MSDFKAKMHQIRFSRPRWGNLQRSPDPLTVFKRPTSKGRGEGERKDGLGNGSDGKGEGRREEGEGGRETKWFISRILLFEPWQLGKTIKIYNNYLRNRRYLVSRAVLLLPLSSSLQIFFRT